VSTYRSDIKKHSALAASGGLNQSLKKSLEAFQYTSIKTFLVKKIYEKWD